jgi:hypothetical protein
MVVPASMEGTILSIEIDSDCGHTNWQFPRRS